MLHGEQEEIEKTLLFHQKYLGAAASSLNYTLTTVLKMTQILEATGKEEEWDNEGLDQGVSTAREFRRLKDTTNSVAKTLRDMALPSAAFGVKFLAKIFGDITLSKLFYNSSCFFYKEPKPSFFRHNII